MISDALIFNTTLFGVLIAVLEASRRRLPALPWWLIHGVPLAWAGLVLIPWWYWSVVRSPWLAGGHSLHISGLRYTAAFHALALVGLVAGVLSSIVYAKRDVSSSFVAGRAAARLPPERKALDIALLACILAYLGGYILSGRPMGALWRLGGEYLYWEDVGGQGLRFLDYSLLLGVGLFLLGRTTKIARIPHGLRVGWLWGVLLVALLLGRGARNWLYLLLIGWLYLSVLRRPGRSTGSDVRARLRAVLIGGLTIVGLGYVAVGISHARAGVGVTTADPLEELVRDIDVLGTGELLYERLGGQPVLRGQSYRELPLLFLPRAIAPDKPWPAADLLVREVLHPTAGYSAPWWLEAGLNYGPYGSLIAAYVYGLCFTGLVIRAGHLRGTGVERHILFAIGPLLPLISYQLLGRLLTFQLLLTVSVLAAAWLLFLWMVRPAYRNVARERSRS